MANYEVKKGVLGTKVLYACPACGVPLTSPLANAGTNDACPDCGQPHVIPGSKERSEADNTKAVQEFRRKLAQEEAAKRKQQAEAAAARKQQEAAKSTAKATVGPVGSDGPESGPSASARPTKATGNHGRSPQRKPRFGDSILDTAFAIARGFSVVVIVTSLFVFLATAAYFLISYREYRPMEIAAITVPTDSDFKTYIDSQKNNSTERDGRGQSQRAEEYVDPMVAVLRKHNLTQSAEYRYIVSLVGELETKLDWDESRNFVKDLDRFLNKQKDKATACIWFCNEYDFNYESREQQRRADELHNAIISSRLWMLATAAGAVFGGLISFMVLPLLIRIEGNTRG